MAIFAMIHLEGFKPPTSRVETDGSIQLSYKCINGTPLNGYASATQRMRGTYQDDFG